MTETQDNMGELIAELIEKYCRRREKARSFYPEETDVSDDTTVIAAKRALADGLNAMLRPGGAVEGE